MSKVRIIGRNISFMAINHLIVGGIAFFLFPFIVKHVGKEIYGVYLIVMTVTGYLGILDLGVMSALTKYVSEYNGKGDMRTMSKIIDASFSFYVLIGVIIALLLFICSMYFSQVFKIEEQNIEVIKQLFRYAALSALLVWPLNTFRGTMQGLNLWSINASISIVTQIINAIAVIMLLSLGYSIIQLFITYQALTILGSLAHYFIIKGKINLKIRFPYLDHKTFKFIFSFSFYLFLTSAIYLFIFQIHNLLIGYFISLSAVTLYAVVYNIQKYFRMINSTLGAPPWTVASEMEGRKDYDGQRKLLFHGTKYMSAAFIPIILIMFFYADPFINYWMGPGFQDSVLPTRIIIVFWLFNGTMELASGMLTAKGIVKKPLLIHASIAVLNVLIGVSLIKILGINAIALGLTISMIIVAFPLLLRLSLKSLGVSFREYFSNAVKPNLVLYFIVITISIITLTYLYPSNFITTLLEMGIIYFISILAYYFFKLNKNEKKEIKKLIGVEIILDKMADA